MLSACRIIRFFILSVSPPPPLLVASFLSLCDNCFRDTYVWRSMIINNKKIINVGENNRQPRWLSSVNVTRFIKYCLPCRFFFLFFYFLMFTFHNLLVWISNNNSHQIATFILVGYSFVNSYRTYSERPNQLSLLTVRQFSYIGWPKNWSLK